MNIQPIDNNVNMYGKGNYSGFWKRIQHKILDAFPEHTIKDGGRKYKNWEKADKFLSKPAENRLIMGATAGVTQPVIDSLNTRVDEETREVSICRTFAKILAGTFVGILVRGSCYNMVVKMTNPKSLKRISKALLPTINLSKLINDEKLLNNYRSALSTSIAVGVCSFTNFILDAPFTIFLTNYFNDKRLEAKKNNTVIKKKGVDYNV